MENFVPPHPVMYSHYVMKKDERITSLKKYRLTITGNDCPGELGGTIGAGSRTHMYILKPYIHAE